MQHQAIQAAARQAYAKYAETVHFENFKGERFPMADWDSLPAHVQKAWVAAVAAIARPAENALRQNAEIETLAYQIADVVVISDPKKFQQVKEILADYLTVKEDA